MTIAYFDCFAGISGDMTLGALGECGADPTLLDAVVESLRLGDEVTLEVRREARGHASGTRVVVGVNDRVERMVPALREVIEQAGAPDSVKAPSLAALNRLARAESEIHGVPEEQVHLHELGGADTLVDIVGAFWLMHALDVRHVFASPLPAPRGIKHGMPLPAPASLRVLEGTGAVLQPTDETRELVTPTGAALVETNLDDMAPTLIAALCEDLMSAGALDVAVVPALMKKGRPGHLLTVMAPPELVGSLTDHLLRHSTTLGVRLTHVDRVLAARRVIAVETPLGSARVKVKELGGRAIDVAPEYEDCRRIARERGIDLRDVMRVVADAARREL